MKVKRLVEIFQGGLSVFASMLFLVFFIAARALQKAAGVSQEITVFDRFVPHLLGVLNVGYFGDLLIPSLVPVDIFQRISNFCGIVLVYGSIANFCFVNYGGASFGRRIANLGRPISGSLRISLVSLFAFFIACSPYFGGAYPHLLLVGAGFAVFVSILKPDAIFGFFAVAILSDSLKMLSVPYLPASRVSILYLAFVLGYELLLRISRLQNDIQSQTALGTAMQVAHDIRAPIGTMKLVMPMLRGDPETKALALNALDRIGRVSRDLLELSRRGADRRYEHLATHDVVLLLSKLTKERRVEFSEKHCQLIFLEPDYPIIGFIDSAIFERVISNILTNALEACASGTGKVEVFCRQKDKFIEIGIRDNGVGISDRVLDSFSRESVKYIATTKEEGSGLGLLYAKRVISDWGGQMHIQSALGHQTLVSLVLPSVAKKAS